MCFKIIIILSIIYITIAILAQNQTQCLTFYCSQMWVIQSKRSDPHISFLTRMKRVGLV